MRNLHSGKLPRWWRALLFSCLLGGVGAQDAVSGLLSLSEEEQRWIHAHPDLTIALDDGNPPLNARLPAGGFGGISVDYLHLIAAKAGFTVHLSGATWNESLRRALAHEVDGIMSASIKDDRKPFLAFTQPYCTMPQAVVTSRGFRPLGELSQLAGARVAVVRGTIRPGIIRQQCPDAIVVELDAAQDALRVLAEGGADAFFDDLPVVQDLLDRNLANLRLALLYVTPDAGAQRFGLRNDLPQLTTIFNQAIAAITTDEHRAIRSRWLRQGDGVAVQRDAGLSDHERAWLAAHPVLRVGLDADWAPIESRTDDGTYHGFTLDYLHRLESLLGVKFIMESTATWQETMDKGRRRELDLLACASDTPQRRTSFAFTAPYVSFPIVLFATSATGYIHQLDGLQGRTVVVVHGCPEEELLQRDWPGITLLMVADARSAIRALTQGRATALVGCLPTTAHLLQEMGNVDVHIVGETPYAYRQGMAVRNDWPELVAILDKGLAAIPAEDREAIRGRWLNLSYQPGFPYRMLGQIGIPIVALFLVFLAWNQRLRREVGQRRMAEEALHSNQERLELARQEAVRLTQEAQAANRAKSEFLSSMSHEIRTPLNAVLGYAQLMARDEALDPAHRRAVEVINRSGEHLLLLINDILEMSRIEAGRSSCEAEDFDLPGLLDNLTSLFLQRARDKDLRLSLESAAGLPRFVRTDQRKLRQILVNLLSNAVKFTVAGEVRLGAQVQDGVLTVAVRDTGPGIAASELAGLFRPFVQAQAGRSRGEGSGLGLALSLGFANVLGGGLTATSQPGQGSTFTLAIPIAIAEKADRVLAGSRQAVGLAPGTARPHLLIVDDHADSREAMRALFHDLGCEVRTAANGALAVAACRERRPDLVWMDIDMPVMDGLSAARAIRELPGPPPLIVACTAAAFASDRERILAGGCDDIVCKPYRETDLLQLMEGLLGLQLVWKELTPAALTPPALDDAGLRAGLQALPQEMREQLRQAVITGDVAAMSALAAAWEDRLLSQAISNLAQNYEFERLLALCDQEAGP